ncbi:MAG: enoyl-CoA hydratase/isomerase family protein [Verrucomicrobia bacterium]|nr:enoyl-CoA hydratase/isomerase family protein [Verrucomicrobiota bacterium]
MSGNLRCELLDSGVAVLTFDRPDSAANIFDQPTFDELNQQLESLEAKGGSLKGLVLRSAKPRIFIAGADLNGFSRERDPQRLGRLIDQGQQTFDRIARLPFPTAAAIHGVALGGGLEIALACDYRVASLDSATKLGLPETNLGILPAWGGSTRLPRLIGLPAALEMILAGKQHAAKPALKIGLVDGVAYPERILAEAVKLVLQGKKRRLKPHLANRAPLSKVIAAQARKRVLAKTRGNYPAPLKALEVAVAGLTSSPAQSLANERREFINLAMGEPAASLIRVFFLQERAKKLAVESAEKPLPVRRAMVVGAGIMGSGIAQWLSARGLRVVLKDIGPEPLGKGMQAIAKLYRDAVKRRIFTEAEARAGSDRILPVFEDNIPLHDVDLVIEAAVEKLDLKCQVFRQLEEKVPFCRVLATNTSALSIDAIADGLPHPEKVVGIHFFNPVHRMQLVEIVRGPRTGPLALATAVQLAKAIGKLPVLVKDSPGFLVNRILLPYLIEAVRIFQEGYPAERIDRLMLDFGMPMGPLRLGDEVGLDVAAHVATDLTQRLSHLPPVNAVLPRMLEKGWLGRKSGKGFYDYQTKGKETLNSQLNEFQALQAPQVDDAELRDRMVLLMVNEAARCLEEGVVTAPEDVDFGMIMGTGWAPFRGGPLNYADSTSLPAVVARLQELQKRVGNYFAPCALLADKAARGDRFYASAPGPESSAGGPPQS